MTLQINFHHAQPGDMAFAVCAVFQQADGGFHVSNGWQVASGRNAAIARHIRAVRAQRPELLSVMLSQAIEAAEHPGVSAG